MVSIVYLINSYDIHHFQQKNLKKPFAISFFVLVLIECAWIAYGWSWVLSSESCFDVFNEGMVSLIGILVTGSIFNSCYLLCSIFVILTGHPLKKTSRNKENKNFSLKKSILFKVCMIFVLFVIPDLNFFNEKMVLFDNK